MKVCSICHHCHDDSAGLCAVCCYPTEFEMRDGDAEMIAGYRLEVLLRSGLVSETYLARQIASGSRCQIRIVSADQQNAEFLLQDARLASGLFHPSITDIYEAGLIDSDRCYIVSEHPAGQTLRECLDDVGTPDLLTSIRIVRETAEALHALHLSGLIHRAIRPDNIILTTDNDNLPMVRIQNPDFGGVIQRSTISNRFLIDSALGLLRYFAPEQCSGADASPLTDVYSLGIVFYEMLAGKLPFDATNGVALIHKQTNLPPPEIRIENFNLRMLVTHSLSESLQKHGRLRQSSANLFARQLRHIEQLATHVSTPPPAGVVPAPVRRERNEVMVAVPTRTVDEPVEPIIETPVDAEIHVVEEPVNVLADPVEIVVSIQVEGEQIEPVEADLTDVINTGDISDPAETDESPELLRVPEQQKEIVHTPPRSRLKRWKKKLHRLMSEVTTATADAPNVAESDGVSTVDDALEPIDETLSAAPEAKVPTKIVWEQPEDDIPSEADVLAVLAAEPEPMPRVAAEPEETAPVVAAMAVEEIVESAIEPDRITPVAQEIVTAIPESEVIVVSPSEEIVPVMAEPKEIPSVVVSPPAEIAAPVAETKEIAPIVLSTESEEVTPVVVPSPQQPDVVIPVAAVSAVEPEKVSVVAPPLVEPETKVVPAPAVVPRTKKLKLPAVPKRPHAEVIAPVAATASPIDLEEITLVRPRSRPIRIQVETPSPRRSSAPVRNFVPHVSTDSVFFPTLFGEIDALPSTEPSDRRDEMFSTYTQTATSRLGHSRSVMIGGGFTLLLALLLFGNNSITRYFQTWTSADSMTAASTPKHPSPPVVSAEPPAKQKKTTKQSEKPTPEVGLTKNVSAPPELKQKPTVKATEIRNASSDKGQKAQATRPDKPTPTIPVKATGTTRPRIVPDERP